MGTEVAEWTHHHLDEVEKEEEIEMKEDVIDDEHSVQETKEG